MRLVSPLRLCIICKDSKRMRETDANDALHERRVFCFDCLSHERAFSSKALETLSLTVTEETRLACDIDLETLLERETYETCSTR